MICVYSQKSTFYTLFEVGFPKAAPQIGNNHIHLSKDFNLRQLKTTLFVGSITCSTCSTYSTMVLQEKMIYQKSLPQHRTKATKKMH